MNCQPKDIVRNEPRGVRRFEHKRLREPMCWVLVRLELAKNVDEDTAVKHGLAVYSSDEVSDFLKCEGAQLLHDLGTALHLLPFKGEQRLLGVVERLQLRPRCRIIKHLVVLGGEGLANGLVVGVQSHLTRPQH